MVFNAETGRSVLPPLPAHEPKDEPEYADPIVWRNALFKYGTECGIRASTKLVMLAIANHVNKLGQVSFPSIATLAKETGLCSRVISTHLRYIAVGGWIRCRSRFKAPNVRTSNEYYLVVPPHLPAVQAYIRNEMMHRMRKGRA